MNGVKWLKVLYKLKISKSFTKAFAAEFFEEFFWNFYVSGGFVPDVYGL